MKNGWPVKSVGDLCVLRPPKAEARGRIAVDAEVSFLPMEDLGIDAKHPNPTKARRLREVEGSYTYFADGDVLLAKITPCFQNGKLGIATGLLNGIGFGSSEFFVLRPNADLDREYLYYFLSRPEFRSQGVERMGGAVGQQRVPSEFLLSQRIILPPLAEQRRIVGILDGAFDDIATAKANTEKNIQNARSLFDGYLQAVFTKRGKGWVEKKLSDICEVKDGTHYSPKYVAEGIPFVTQKNVRQDGLSFAKTKLISAEDHADFFRRSNATRGDILISMIGANRGMACVVDDNRIFSIKNVGLVKENEAINQQFLLYYLKSSQAAEYVRTESKGGAQEFLGLTELRRFPVPLPPKKQQDVLAEKFQAVRAETQRLESLYQRKLAALVSLKKSLLHQAFTGQL
jgi:type I restriction enzyme S subunit